MKNLLRCACVPSLLLLVSSMAGCDNIGRAFDPQVDPGGGGTTTESAVEEVPVGGVPVTGRPKVKAAFPKDGGWPTTVPIVVEFSESVNQASIKPTSTGGTDGRVVLRLKSVQQGQTAQVLPCQYNFLAQGRLLVMRPVTALSNQQTPTYEVVLLPDARDCDGVRFDVPAAGTVLTEFQVNQDEAIVDGRILTTYPRDNARDLTREGDVIVVFDRPATAASLTSASLQVQPSGGAPLSGSPGTPLSSQGVADSRVASFRPGATLSASTQFELVVTADITFGSSGKLDFKGRTPFATFQTVAPRAPSLVELGNPTPGFAGKINQNNFANAHLDVTTPDDTAVGDRVRVRIYGGDKSTTATGDLLLIERTADVTQAGAQTVAVDFAGAFGTITSPKFDEGSLTFAAQMLRGSQASGFVRQPNSASPEFDVTRPEVLQVGPPASADGRDIRSDLEHVAFYGKVSERIASAELTAGASTATLFASDETGAFLMSPLALHRLSGSLGYVLTVTDTAGNLTAAPFAGNILQRGAITGTLPGTLTIEAYDAATLEPVVGASVVVDAGAPVVPPTAQFLPGVTDASGRVFYDNLSTTSHTITIVAAGYDLVTLYATQAAFVSLPLRALTNPTANLTGTAAFTPGAGVTALVGSTAFASRSPFGVRTTNAAPTAIPSTPITPNRPQIVTGFAGTFEPTANPPFTANGAQFLGTTLTEPTPPTAPVAGGASSQQAIALLPSTGQVSALSPIVVDFATATGLDLGNLVGNGPRVRMTTSLLGFEGQALVGVGFVSGTAATAFTLDASYSTPIVAALGALSPLLWMVAEAQDALGNASRTRYLVLPPATFPGPGPLPIPAVLAPPGPVGPAPAISYVDALDVISPPSVLGTTDITATDAAGRRWLVLVADRDVAGGTKTVQLPDLTAAGVPGLASGNWNVVVESRLWSAIVGCTADDCVLTERVRNEIEYVRSASTTFVVQ